MLWKRKFWKQWPQLPHSETRKSRINWGKKKNMMKIRMEISEIENKNSRNRKYRKKQEKSIKLWCHGVVFFCLGFMRFLDLWIYSFCEIWTLLWNYMFKYFFLSLPFSPFVTPVICMLTTWYFPSLLNFFHF